ncbi:MAG: tRNA lysidine(34) synthetase TilS [Coxiellaceae bacterium]|nr:tRNA lysidine(34) synthetase TilS [Coxiellaceae bacterium]
MSIRGAVECLLSFSGECNFVVAYSGGVDSHVLLHLLAHQKNVTAVHVNHQLNPKSNVWAAHCEKICDELEIPLSIEKATIELKPGDSLEEKAREARYAILKRYVDKSSVLVTAHNLNDQAETFLFQALRGAGTKGLSAMPVKKIFGERFLIRPLLTVSREDIEKYARENKLQWIEDDSNVDTKFNRNFLRHDIFPLLKTRFPKCMENFARTARLMAEQETIISDIANADYQIVKKRAQQGVCTSEASLSVAELSQFSEARQRLILREWFRKNNLRMPNEKHLKQIQKDVLTAAPDAHPKFKLGDIILVRERGFLKLI